MKIKWLYKIAMPTIAIASIAPVVVSCSVEKIKPETQAEKEKRLEHQKAMEIAPNLTKFLKKHEWRGYDNYNKDYIWIKDIKQLKELTSNINHLNDFEKSYLGLYEDIQNFFDNSIHRYTKDNISFEYFDDIDSDRDSKTFPVYLKLEESTISQEQMFYHKIFQIMNDETYRSNNLERNEDTIKHFRETLTPIINEKIVEFSKKHKDFQFKNPELKFRYGKNGEKIIEVSVEVEYQNQKLPKELIIPLTFDFSLMTDYRLEKEEQIQETFLDYKKTFNESLNQGYQRRNVKTFAELENVLKSKPNEVNNNRLKEMKEAYEDFIKENSDETFDKE